MTGFPTIDAILIFGSLAAALAFGVWAVLPKGRVGPEDGE